MGKSFRKVTLCSTNDFLDPENQKIQQWVESNGGTFVTEITPKTTHLLASRKAWKHDIALGSLIHHRELLPC
jgi:BRCA1 C Terminus (BRCT) domain